ncbi:MAG: GntP family permease [Verrucomicrobia bacterium]|jgi:gluconate:H+ symporter, GntP family|nr:GntP family permease [Verrucomicrobiota bacterium]
MEIFAQIAAPVSYWPFGILAISMVFVVVMIAVLRIHAFISLMLAAALVGFLSGKLPGSPETSSLIKALDLPMVEFGATAGKIAWVIALASIIGICLMESGAADRIVRQIMRVLGEHRAPWALLISGFILGIPVFFDTVFFLMVPLAMALALRLGKNYLLLVMAICSGAAVTHHLVPPTPGPLFMVEALGLNLGSAIVVGIVIGLPPAIIAVLASRRLDLKMNLPVRESPGISMDDLKQIASKSDDELPPFWLSILPVALPVVLIAAASFFGAFGGREMLGGAYLWVEFLGNKYLAMFLGTVIALWLLARQKKMSLQALGEAMGPPLSTAGIIILITAAGGAFGTMIKHAGVGESIQALSSKIGLSYILLAFLVASVMKIAQGSGTVAMITTSGMMAAVLADGTALPYHPVYVYLAIGFGSMVFSWMNDSGFWVVCKLSGFTEKETLRSWTLILALIGVVGLIEVLIVSRVFPMPLAN